MTTRPFTFLLPLFSLILFLPIHAQILQCSDWETQDSGITNPIHFLNAIAVDQSGMMVVAGRDGFLHSFDGTTWIIQPAVTSTTLNTITTNGTTWVAGGDDGVIFSSPDGINWTEQSTPTDSIIHDILWNGSQFIAVGYFLDPFDPDPSVLVMTSAEGQNWTIANATLPIYHYSLSWNQDSQNPLYVAGGHDAIYTSTDLSTWTEQALGLGFFNITDLSFLSGTFYAVASDFPESHLLSSSDGQNWSILFTAPHPLTSLIIKDTGETRFALVGGGATGISFTSNDLENWNEETHINRLHEGIWNVALHSFVAVGAAAIIRTQTCEICTFSLSVNPASIAQGLNPITFTANPECGIEPYTFEWMDENKNHISTDQTIEIQPTLTETETFILIVTDEDQNELQAQATILVSSNPLLTDPNGDGENTLEDLFLVGLDWTTNLTSFDADGDGRITVLDLQYVNTGNLVE